MLEDTDTGEGQGGRDLAAILGVFFTFNHLAYMLLSKVTETENNQSLHWRNEKKTSVA